MLYPILALVVGLIVLVFSADRFVEGSARVAKFYNVSPLLIGMLVIGFGTSAPEMVVSVISSYQGNSGIALGNAYGSNIANIGLILGLTALIRPITVHSQVLRKELPILTLVTLASVYLLKDLEVSRMDASILLILFAGLMVWTVMQQTQSKGDHLGVEVEEDMREVKVNIKKSYIEVALGLIFLILSSRLFVWGAVEIAQAAGVSDIVIGLTIVAVGTSLPELASSIIAARKGESDLALGNILGSNLFNSLAVVGLAGVISPLTMESIVFNRDMISVVIFTVSLFVFGYGFRGQGRINRVEGIILILGYAVYNYILLR